MAEHDLVDITGRDAGVGECPARHAHDQALDRLPFEATERGMGPTNNASGHRGLLLFWHQLRFPVIVVEMQQRPKLPKFGRFLLTLNHAGGTSVRSGAFRFCLSSPVGLDSFPCLWKVSEARRN